MRNWTNEEGFKRTRVGLKEKNEEIYTTPSRIQDIINSQRPNILKIIGNKSHLISDYYSATKIDEIDHL